MDIVRVVVGLMVLALGRRLFWVFVGVVGFAAGIAVATRFLSAQPEWVVLIIALATGLIGALLAVFLQQLAIALAGFIGGGYIVVSLLEVLGLPGPGSTWIAFVIGGIIGLVLVVALFDWALIVLSSLVGASMIVQALHIRPLVAGVFFTVSFIVGLGIQASLLRPSRSEPSPTAGA